MQILVVVANTQVIILRADAGKVSKGSSVHLGLAGPKHSWLFI